MKNISKFIPILISVVISIIVFRLLLCQASFTDTLTSSREYIFTITGLLAGIIMAYLTSKILQIRQEKIAKLPRINELTQKMHRFRSVVNTLLSSELLPRKARSIVDNKYKGLTFYDYREIGFVNSKPTKQSLDYINDTAYSGLSDLYLELRAFVPKNHGFDETLYSEFEVSTFYDTQLLEKWVDYDCGCGLWYCFDYKYALYKNSFDLNIYEGHKDEILKSCLQIDKERYQGMSFDAPLLAKLGAQMYEEIIPKLFKAQLSIEKGLPKIVKYLFSIFVLLVLFGVITPLLSTIFNLCPIWDVISISATIGICTYIILSFYGFMKQEIIIGKAIEI